MKSPDEIKKGLECCSSIANCADGCPYHVIVEGSFGCDEMGCEDGLLPDALALIQQLEAQIPRWISAKEPPKKWRLDDKEKTLINFLIYSPEFGVDVGNYLEPAKTWVLFGVPVKITHWMDIASLPVIPEEE